MNAIDPLTVCKKNKKEEMSPRKGDKKKDQL